MGLMCQFLAYRWHTTYCWKALNEGYNFALDLVSIKGFHTKLCTPKVIGIPILEILGLPFGSPETKWNQVLVSWLGTKYTIKGKVVASPKSGSWWVLWIYVCMWFVHAPKCFNYTLTNLLFGLCKSVWVIELFVNLPSPSWSSSTPLYPRSVVNEGTHPNSISFHYIHLYTYSWVHQGAWGCVKRCFLFGGHCIFRACKFWSRDCKLSSSCCLFWHCH